MKPLITLNLIIGILLLGGRLSSAQDGAPELCPKAQSTVEMLDCASGVFQKEEAQMNQNYQEVLKFLSGKDTKNLKDAQQAWLDFRKRNCAFYSSLNEGGSLAPVSGMFCQARMTQGRNAELSLQLDRFKKTRTAQVPQASPARAAQ